MFMFRWDPVGYGIATLPMAANYGQGCQLEHIARARLLGLLSKRRNIVYALTDPTNSGVQVVSLNLHCAKAFGTPPPRTMPKPHRL